MPYDEGMMWLEDKIEDLQTELDRMRVQLEEVKEDSQAKVVKVQFAGSATTYNYWTCHWKEIEPGGYAQVFGYRSNKVEIVKVIGIGLPPKYIKPTSPHYVYPVEWKCDPRAV